MVQKGKYIVLPSIVYRKSFELEVIYSTSSLQLEYKRNQNLQALTRKQPGIRYLVLGTNFFHFPGTCSGSWFAIFRFYCYNHELQAFIPSLNKKLLVYQELIGLTRKQFSAYPILSNRQSFIFGFSSLLYFKSYSIL